MRFRKLRIAWSVLCGVLCLLLIALWVRSYSFRDSVNGQPSTGKGFNATSWQGRVSFLWAYDPRLVANLQWEYSAMPAELYARIMREHLLDVQEVTGGRSQVRTDAGFLGFYSENDPYLGWRVIVPYWFLVVVAGMSALLATIFALPKLFRFSLRTLLIATTLVAAGLGLIVYAAR